MSAGWDTSRDLGQSLPPFEVGESDGGSLPLSTPYSGPLPKPPTTSSEYIQLVSHPWKESEIAEAEDAGLDVHWLARAGRVPPTTSRPGVRHRKLQYKNQAEALNMEAHPGHLHEQVFSSPQHKDRAMGIVVLLGLICAAAVFTTALNAQLFFLLRVDRTGLRHLQLKPSRVLSEGRVEANAVELVAGAVVPLTVAPGSNTTIAAGAAEFVTLEMRTSSGGSPYATVHASQRAVGVAAPRLSVAAADGTAGLVVAANRTEVACDATVRLRNASVAPDSGLSVARIQSVGGQPLSIASSSGPTRIVAGRSVQLETNPTAATAAVTGGREVSVTAVGLVLAGGARPGGDVRINMSLLRAQPAAAANLRALKVCACPLTVSASKTGALFLMPPNISCADWTADDAYGSVDPCA